MLRDQVPSLSWSEMSHGPTSPTNLQSHQDTWPPAMCVETCAVLSEIPQSSRSAGAQPHPWQIMKWYVLSWKVFLEQSQSVLMYCLANLLVFSIQPSTNSWICHMEVIKRNIFLLDWGTVFKAVDNGRHSLSFYIVFLCSQIQLLLNKKALSKFWTIFARQTSWKG